MTQKELLYLEDAIGHEKNLVQICRETMNVLENEDLKRFMEEEIKIHEIQKNDLLSLLEAESYE